ncbi:hypothetical protein [Yersinia enterocolitica]|nr:hypothetical protein [Yersinia enterocolitica]
MLFIWRPFIKPRCMFTTVKRDELKASEGRLLLMTCYPFIFLTA